LSRLGLAVLIGSTLACGVDGTVFVPRDLERADEEVPGPVILPGSEPAPPSVLEVFSGQAHACALASGVALCWGKNAGGALGTDDTTDHDAPTRVAGGLVFDALAAGRAHTCGLERGSGRVLCWGSGGEGQLGQGDTADRRAPVAVPLPAPATRVSTSYDHTCALLADGSLHCWGKNDEHQLGLGDTEPRLTPARVGADSDWINVAAGQGHTCGLRRPGTLWCWGRNTDGQLGLGSPSASAIRVITPAVVGTRSDWRRLDLGQNASVGITSDGGLYWWGRVNGLLPGASAIPFSPARVDLRSDWIDVSTDTLHTCGRTLSNQLFCWGRNVEGQLGLDDGIDRDTPTAVVHPAARWTAVSVGRFFTCAVSETRVLSCTGRMPNEERFSTFTPFVLPPDLDPARLP